MLPLKGRYVITYSMELKSLFLELILDKVGSIDLILGQSARCINTKKRTVFLRILKNMGNFPKNKLLTQAMEMRGDG